MIRRSNPTHLRRTFLLLAIVVLSSAPRSLPARTWTSPDGRTLEADFVSATASAVTLKRPGDGRTFTVPMEKLSAADKEWVKSQPAASAPGEAPPSAVPAEPLEGPFAKLATGDWALSEYKSLPFAMWAAKNLDPSHKIPLVLTLHGKSDNNTNGKQVGGWMRSLTKPANQSANPCIVVAPLCYQPYGGSGGGWRDKPGDQAITLIKDMIKSLPVDEKRIYVAGHSMGGFGTCHLIEEEPRLFAAGVPMAGCGGSESAFKRTPLWLFHAADDKVVDVKISRDFAEALKRSKTFKYTEYPSGGHGIADRVFDTPELHIWLFSQTR